ncbi:MAG TPA: pectate lyase [Verrucomicrobiota bacterium]|nr:pectate lyase [Verrucomicrobiota bacterium]
MKSSKFQAPSSTEVPNTNIHERAVAGRNLFEAWRLNFLWMLALGCWCFAAEAQEASAVLTTNSTATSLASTNANNPPLDTNRLASLRRRGPSAESLLSRPDDWFRAEQGQTAISNVLSWQSAQGDWPSNTRTPALPFEGDRSKLRGNFDNGATTGELRFLAKAFVATQDTNCAAAFYKGLDLILKAQYPTGGWPQNYPPDDQYHRHITFNDNAMVRLMKFVRDVATQPEFRFVDEPRRQAAQAAFDRGVECILKCQIKVNGKLTVWCAQHDELDYRPRSGRTFELVSLSGSESGDILELLMSLDKPSLEVARAINAGVKWFEDSRITGIRIVRENRDRIVVPDENAPPVWARFYEIETNRPIFSGRDSVKKYNLAEIELERRRGYSWYGAWGNEVAEAYSKWKTKWPEAAKQQ